MTQATAKRREALQVAQFAELLGLDWTIVAQREAPDFLIQSSGEVFALEVTSVFIDDGEAGSAMRAREGSANKILQTVRREYERRGGPTIDLKLARRPRGDDVGVLVEILLALDLGSCVVGTRAEFVPPAGGRAWVQRSFRPRWIIVEDAVGWVAQEGRAQLQHAIARKAERLSAYRQNSGREVRLLVVADRMLNSGKVIVAPDAAIDKMGFEAVYLYSQPDGGCIWSSEVTR